MTKNTTHRGATKRFTRRLTLTFIITLLLIAGAIVIAYSKGTDKGAELYQKEFQGALWSAYDQGVEDGAANFQSMIESAEINGFALDGDDFVVYLLIAGEEHEYRCDAGNVVEALPFQQGN